MTYLLYLIFISFIIIGVFKYRQVFNPLTIFNGIWFVTIFLYNFRLSYLQNELQKETILIFIVMICSFNISYVFFSLIYTTIYKKKINLKSNKFNLCVTRKNIIRMFRFWFVIELVEIVYSGGFPLLWKFTGNPKTYFDFGINTVHGLANAFALIITLVSYTYFLKVNRNDKHIRNILIVVLLSYVAFLSRQVIISAAIELVIISYLYLKEKGIKIRIGKYVTLIAIGIIAFGVLGNLRTGYDGFYNVAVMKKQLPSLFTGIHWCYMYLTMTVANIDHMAVMELGNTANGVVASTFIPSIIRDIFFETSPINLNLYLVTPAFNVGGFFREFYIDLGMIGVSLISFVYGGIGGWIYNKYLTIKNNQNAMYYAIYTQIIILSFFYNQLLYLPSGFQFIIVFLLCIFFKNKWRW